MKKITDIFYFLGRKFILLLSALILSLLVGFRLQGRGRMLVNIHEKVEYLPNNYHFFIFLTVAFIILFLLRYVIVFINENILFVLGTIIWISFGIYLILNVDGIMRSDPNYVFQSALQLNDGDKSPFIQSGLSNYLSIFPMQTGLVTFFRIYAFFSSSPKFIWFCQLMMIIGINYLLWKIANKAFQNRLLNNYVIIFSFLFLPSLFMILWGYGDIPGLLFVLFSLYCFIEFIKNDNLLMFYPIFISLFLAVLVRSNYLIFAIALISCLILNFFENKKFHSVLMGGIIILSISLPGLIISSYYRQIEHVAIPPSIPTSAWIVMGLNDKAGTPGYWDGYTTLVPVNNGYNMNKIEGIVKSDLENRISILTENPNLAIEFFISKLKGTWNESTFQSVYVGPMSERGQFAHTEFLKGFYENGKNYEVYNYYCSILVSVILITCLFAVVYEMFFKKSTNILIIFTQIYIIGGFIFHLFWETKSRYVYPYVFLLIFVTAWQFSKITEKNL